MLRTIRTGTTYANSVSTIALIVALMGGSTAMAAAELAKNSVGSEHIRDGAVRAAELSPNSVTGSKVVDGALRGADLKDGSVTGHDIDESTLGQVPRAEYAEAADTADEARTAAHAQTATRLLGLNRASVTANGVLKPNLSVGAVSAAETDTPGRYVVSFDGPILGCFPMASVAHNEITRVAGSASAWIRPLADNPKLNQIMVETHVPGAADSVPDPAPFSLLLICGS